MSADKRRLARLQGGVNRGQERGRRSDPENYTVRNRNEDVAGGNLSGEFKFEETTVKIRKQPADIFINTPGQHDLSDEPTGPSWIKFYPNFLDEDVATDFFNTLLKDIKWEKCFVKIHGEIYESPRLIKWYGPLDYEYSGMRMKQNEKWHDVAMAIRRNVEQILGTEFNSVLLNQYRNEHDSVAWHSDDELSMGINPTIASVSLGELRTFELRKKPPPEDYGNFEYMQHYKMKLPHGSLVVMDGCTQTDWQHRVPKDSHNRKQRINLTFRTVVPKKE